MDNTEKQIHKHQVLQYELKTLRKHATVYKQQQNSQIFFKASIDKAMADSKKTLDDLMAEYRNAEASTNPRDIPQNEG